MAKTFGQVVARLPSPRSSTSDGRLLQNSKPVELAPSGATEAVALVTSCLTLVKPVGMSGEDAHAWLTVATGEVAHLPRDILEAACAAARRTCTHHGQIVPTILKEGEELLSLRRTRLGVDVIPRDRHLPAPDRWKPSAEEIELIKADAAAGLHGRGAA